MTVPDGVRLRSLPLNARSLQQAEEVGAWGYPLGEELGSRVKFSRGSVSDPLINDPQFKGKMILLDQKVNPGNSGGPLCDTKGNVVGMITAKTRGGTFLESYGLALPAKSLSDFLGAKLKGYTPSAARTKDQK